LYLPRNSDWEDHGKNSAPFFALSSPIGPICSPSASSSRLPTIGRDMATAL
jgi:hypothetical protein